MDAKPREPRRFFRRPLPLLAGLLCGTAVLGIWLFVINFDLDQYREQIAAEASRQLQLPVNIGHARLEFREAGIACRFTDVTIGSPQTERELTAETIWLQLAWRGVFKRQPIFSEVALNEPHLRVAIDTTKPDEPTEPPSESETDWLDELGIRRIELRHGTLDLSWQTDRQQEAEQLRVYAVELDVDNLAKGKHVLIGLSGQLSDNPQKPERFNLKGSLQLLAGRPLTVGAWELDLTARDVNSAQLVALLPEHYAIAASGAADLAINLHGTAATEATLQGRLGGDQLRVRPGTAYQQERPLRDLQIAGAWQRSPAGHSFRNVKVQLDKAHLAGTLNVMDSDDAHTLHVDLDSGSLPLATILPWLPEQLQRDHVVLKQLRPQGLLTVDAATFQVRFPRKPGEPSAIRVQTLQGLARQLAWRLDDDTTLEVVNLPIALMDGRWHVTDAEVRLGKVPGKLNGAVIQQEKASPLINLDLKTSGDAGDFASLAPGSLPEQLKIGGRVGLHGHIEGPVDELALDLRLDLSQLQGSYGEVLTLSATGDAAWTTRGTLFPDHLAIAHSELSLFPLHGKFQGAFNWSGEPNVNLDGTMRVDNIIDLYRHVPALAKSGVHGGIALALNVSGPLKTPSYRGGVTLNGVGVPMHGIIADISGIRGQLQVDGRRLQGEEVTALLGHSPVTLRVNIPDLGKPHLDLKVRAAAVRADELIFRSDTRRLRDLNGRLLIDDNSLAFAPVHVRLDQGTRATIHGSVKDFANPKVDLSISGEYANVEEIIALWTDESPAAHAARVARHAGSPAAPLPPIRIEVNAKSGDLYGMQFADARALIVPSDRHLLLHPLDFKVGEGYCSTQVLLDYSQGPSLIRVSGHAENVDAFQVHNELLDRKSIMRGTLRGDFYLQGKLGGPGPQSFLPTSFGNIRFTVKDGVMRHSPLIGSLFSVLNVSQLFQGKLPDVSREGVPFTLLTAEINIDQGMLHAKELVMQSNALDMSYLGQYHMIDDQLDLLVVVKPLSTVDKVVSHLPVAGWVLTGDERTFLTAQFKVTGSGSDPQIEAIPISTLSKGVLGLIQRTLSLPYKLVTDPAILWGGGGQKD